MSKAESDCIDRNSLWRATEALRAAEHALTGGRRGHVRLCNDAQKGVGPQGEFANVLNSGVTDIRGSARPII